MKPARSRAFWPLIALASLLQAAAAACVTAALLKRDDLAFQAAEHSSGWTNYVPLTERPSPLPWVVAAVTLALASAFTLALAARRR